MQDSQTNQEILFNLNKRLKSENIEQYQTTVKEIINNVKTNGNQALAYYTEKFDKQKFEIDSNPEPFRVKIDLIKKPNFKNLTKDLQDTLLLAKKRIEKFHKTEMKQHSYRSGWFFKGDLKEKLGVKYAPLDSVAIYVPGGKAPLLSTTLMTAIPAICAGVTRIVLLSPPPVHSSILACAEMLGIEEVYSLGGAQAIAGLAYGTESIRAVDKIVGPGNIFVSLAKKEVFGDIGIDGIFGPSELAILCDQTANPQQVACDLLSQLEHGSGLESTILVSLDLNLIEKTKEYIEFQLQDLAHQNLKTPEQISTIKNSLRDWSAFLHTSNLEEACSLINQYAPEHLEIILAQNNLNKSLEYIKNAGAIFIGTNSCESLGDYLAGPSHCLPTGRTARFSSGLQCQDFLKKISIIDFSKTSAKSSKFLDLAKKVACFARAEKLEMHARAIEKRI
jgi:histidinol dehydrogenase